MKRYRNKGADTEIDEATVMALKVLSTIGVTNSSIEVFKDYISDEKYAALCYRALYKYDFSFAGEYFDYIFDMYKKNASTMSDIFELLEKFKTPSRTMEVIHHTINKHSKREGMISIDRPWVLSLKEFLKPKEYELNFSKKEQVKDQIFVSHGSECLTEDVPEELRYYDNSPDHGRKVIEAVNSYFVRV